MGWEAGARQPSSACVLSLHQGPLFSSQSPAREACLAAGHLLLVWTDELGETTASSGEVWVGQERRERGLVIFPPPSLSFP